MHELGMIVHLAKTLERIAEDENLSKIGKITLQVGDVSGIITDYFADCWNYFKVRYPTLGESEIYIESIPAITWCDDCKGTFETIRYGKECPYCHSEKTWLLQGNECIIKEIEALCAS